MTKAFDIHLARTGKRLQVPAHRSIVDVLVEAGVRVPHVCCRGICGSCETRVLAGTPDHRDMVLLGREAGATDRMMVCVSRSLSPTLILDL